MPLFEGPLDLLLHLIREHRIDIYDIPIALITRQYLEYLALLESLDLAIAGEYLVMAATLLEIKSRLLLPQPPAIEQEEDPRAELVQKLVEYQRYQGTVEMLRGWEEMRRMVFFRGALENPEDYVLPIGPSELNPDALLNALRQLLTSTGIGESPVTSIVPRRRVSLRMRMAEMLRRMRLNAQGLEFEQLLDRPWTRYDLVMTFLALLELLRLGRLRAAQKRPVDPITVYPAELAAA